MLPSPHEHAHSTTFKTWSALLNFICLLHRSHIVVQVSTPTKNSRLETLVFLVCHLTDENCSDFVHLIYVARYLVAPGFGALGVYSEALTNSGCFQKIFAIH